MGNVCTSAGRNPSGIYNGDAQCMLYPGMANQVIYYKPTNQEPFSVLEYASMCTDDSYGEVIVNYPDFGGTSCCGYLKLDGTEQSNTCTNLYKGSMREGEYTASVYLGGPIGFTEYAFTITHAQATVTDGVATVTNTVTPTEYFEATTYSTEVVTETRSQVTVTGRGRRPTRTVVVNNPRATVTKTFTVTKRPIVPSYAFRYKVVTKTAPCTKLRYRKAGNRAAWDGKFENLSDGDRKRFSRLSQKDQAQIKAFLAKKSLTQRDTPVLEKRIVLAEPVPVIQPAYLGDGPATVTVPSSTSTVDEVSPNTVKSTTTITLPTESTRTVNPTPKTTTVYLGDRTRTITVNPRPRTIWSVSKKVIPVTKKITITNTHVTTTTPVCWPRRGRN